MNHNSNYYITVPVLSYFTMRSWKFDDFSQYQFSSTNNKNQQQDMNRKQQSSISPSPSKKKKMTPEESRIIMAACKYHGRENIDDIMSDPKVVVLGRDRKHILNHIAHVMRSRVQDSSDEINTNSVESRERRWGRSSTSFWQTNCTRFSNTKESRREHILNSINNNNKKEMCRMTRDDCTWSNNKKHTSNSCYKWWCFNSNNNNN